MTRNTLAIAFVILVLAAAPFRLYPIFLMECLSYAVFACAFNLLFGYAGLLSFGHAAFFGTGAYLAGYVAKEMAAPPELALFVGAACATILSVPFGMLSIRREGVYFAMITFALGQLIYFVALQSPFTGGEDGLQSIPRGLLFGFIDLNDEMRMYYFVLAVSIAAFAIIYRIVNSPFGEVLLAIRENPMRAMSLGYQVERYKLLAFVLSASFAGLAGGLKALTFHFSSLNNIFWHQSGEVVLMTLLGGAGTILGPVLGAVFVVSMQHFLSELGDWVTFIIGATFVVCVLSFRKGLVGEIAAWSSRRRSSAKVSQVGRADRESLITIDGMIVIGAASSPARSKE